MKTKLRILFVCGHDEIRHTVLRLIHAQEHWEADGSPDAESAIEQFCLLRYDLVLVGSGLSDADDERMRRLMRLRLPSIRIMDHFGGGSGLLWNEIREAFSANEQITL